MLAGGLNNVEMALDETKSSGEGFRFDYAATGGVAATPFTRTDNDADRLRRFWFCWSPPEGKGGVDGCLKRRKMRQPSEVFAQRSNRICSCMFSRLIYFRF
jgi:hypothetical protein